MKRFVALIIALMMILLVVACGEEPIGTDDTNSTTESTQQGTEENNDPVGVQLESEDGIIKFFLNAGEDGKAATATLYRWDAAVSTLVVPETVTYNGHEYPITVIGLGQNVASFPNAIATLVLSENVKVINGSAFSMCTNLTSIAFAEGLEKISASAFIGCSSLTTVSLPSTVKTVEKKAFYGCVSLSSVVINTGIEKLEDDAFYFCSGLGTISIPRSFNDRISTIFSMCETVMNGSCVIVYPD